MSRLQNLMLSFGFALTVLGLSAGAGFAETFDQSEQGVEPRAVSQMSAGPIPVGFTITDVSIEGNRLTLHGQRVDSETPTSLTIQVPKSRETAEADNASNRLFDRVFNRDDAS